MEKKIIITTRITCALFFILSLTQQALCFNHKCMDPLFGIFMGWFVVVVGGANLAWLTNLFLILSFILIVKNKKATIITSLIGILLGLSPIITNKLAIDESGTSYEIISYGVGYWLWLASIIVILFGTLLIILNKKTKPNNVYN